MFFIDQVRNSLYGYNEHFHSNADPIRWGCVYVFLILNMVRFSISLSLNSKRMKNKSLISIECSEKFNTNSVFYRFFGVRFSEGNIPKSVELNFLS